MIIFFFSYAWVFFTMRDKVKTLPSRLPLWKGKETGYFFSFFFFLWKSDVIWKEREIICIVFYCTVNVRMFFSRYAIIYGLWHVSCEDKWQLDWIVFFSFFLYAIFLETERERFFFLIGGSFILIYKRSPRRDIGSGIFWNVLIVRVEVTSYLDGFICGFVWMGTGIRCDSIR